MADETLKTVLGFDATGALSTLSALNTALASYTKNMGAAAGVTRDYNSAASRVDKSLKNQAATVKGAATAHGNLSTQSKQSQQALRGVSTQAETVNRTIGRLGKTTKKAGGDMILTWKSVIRIFTIQVIHQMVSKITSSLSAAAQAARKFEIGIAEVETIASGMGVSFDKLAEQAKNVSIALGQPLDIVVEAQYQLYSNQVGNATESLMAFEAAQKLSIAGVTPLNSAIALITGTLNAYGESSTQAETIAAKLFKTVELGRVRISEMGDTLGRVTVLGAQLGISLDEILASIATLTIQGVKANDAMTQILNVELKLLKPTDDMKNAMAELGIVSGEAGIQAFGFQGFLAKLKETTSGTATDMGKLFGRVRATRGALGVTGKAAEKYAKRLEAIKSATSELLDEKVELIFRTNAKQVEIELNRLSVQVTENFGRGINTILKETFDAFGGGTETLLTFGSAATAAGATFLLMRTNLLVNMTALFGYTKVLNVATGSMVWMRTTSIATTLSLAKLRAATIAFLATPVGAALVMATAIVGIGLAYNRAEKAAKKYFEEVAEGLDRTLKKTLKAFDKETKEHKDVFVARLKELQKYLTANVKLETEAARKSKILEEQLHKSFVQQVTSRVQAIQSYADGITGIIDGLTGKLKSLREDSRDIKSTLEAFKFERKTKGMGDVEKYHANIAKAAHLRWKAQTAIFRGEFELSKILSERSQQYAKQALSVADTLENHKFIEKAEAGVITGYNQQLNIVEQIGWREEKRASQAEKSAGGLFQQVSTLESLAKQYSDLGTKISDIKTTDEERINLVKEQLILAGKMTDEFDTFKKRGKEAKFLGLEEEFNAAIKAFREPLTGLKMDLSGIVLFDASVLAKTLQFTLDEVGKSVQIRVKTITGEERPTAAAEALTKAPAELDTHIGKQRDIVNAQGVINKLLSETQTKTVAVTEALREQEAWYVTGQRNLDTLAKTFLSIWSPTGKIEPTGDFGQDVEINRINTMAISIQRLITSGGNIGEINRRLEALANVKFSLIDKEMFGVANTLDTLIDTLSAGRDAFAQIEDSKDIDMTPAVTAFEQTTTALDRMTTSAINARNALGLVGGINAAAQERSLGGMIYRQLGGFTPRGTDTVPAMLSPGEFVVNAKSSKQFFSQLVAINSGTQPVYRAEGGPVTTIGDVSISVNGTRAPQQTAREIMSAFKRETRRGTSKIK